MGAFWCSSGCTTIPSTTKMGNATEGDMVHGTQCQSKFCCKPILSDSNRHHQTYVKNMPSTHSLRGEGSGDGGGGSGGGGGGDAG